MKNIILLTTLLLLGASSQAQILPSFGDSRTGTTGLQFLKIAPDQTGVARPDNTVLFFDENGENTGYANGLNPKVSSLKSALEIS